MHDFSNVHNFHLTGPGVNLWTGVEEIAHPIWTLNLTRGTYRFACDPHALTLKGSFTVGTVAAPVRCRVPKVVGRTLVVARRTIRRSNCAVGRLRYVRSARPKGRVVSQSRRAGLTLRRGTKVNLVLSKGRPVLRTRGTPDLIGRALDDFTIDLRFPDNTEVTTLPAGTYTIEVRDLSTFHNYHLRGPGGVDLFTSEPAVETVIWQVNLSPGAVSL